FQPHGLFDRAAFLAGRENLHRLPSVPAVSAVWPVRDGRAGRRRLRRSGSETGRIRPQRARSAAGRHGAHRMTVAVASGGVTTPRGFRAAGVSAGIKASGDADLALLVSDTAATAAA